MEEIIGIIAFIWLGFGDRMLNSKNSRIKRIIFFLLFYVPLAAVLVWAASAAYSRIGFLFSFLLYVLMIFLLFFLGLRAWYGTKEREKEAFRKMYQRTMHFWVRYRSRLMNDRTKIASKIFFFVLLFLPFYVVPGLMMLLMESSVPFMLPVMFITVILTIIAAIIVFYDKRK